ncbi:MAG: DUF222 domain-containing protein [Actinomycetota bacterium]
MEELTGPGTQPPVLRLAGELTAGARQVAAAPLLTLSTVERADLLDQLAALERAAAAARLAVLRALDGADLSVLGATSLAALVSARLLAPLGRARADVAAARATSPDGGSLAGMGAALLAGQVSMGHVDVAVGVLDKIPARVRAQAAPTIDEFCVDVSGRYQPREVANLAREILDRLDPDRGHDPDAFTRRGFTLTGDAYGMGVASGQLDPATFAVLKTALDHYAAPTPRQRDTDGAVVFTDDRTPAQRRCDALAEIARRALAAAGTGAEGTTRNGEAPRVVLHATPDQVSGADAVGTVDGEATGPLPAAFLRPLVCDCVLERVLLAPSGAVLDLGRTVRTATPAQRRALHARDRGCIWPGCTIPARWTDVHHVTAWIHGGATDVAGLALLCGAHHAMVEHGHYRIVMIDGVPHVIPPPWVDPDQTPVRNTYWLDQDRARHTGRQLALALDIRPRARPPDTG